MIELLRQNMRLAAVIAVVIVLVVVNIMFYFQWQSAKGDRVELESELDRAEVNLRLTSAQNDLAELQAQEDALSGKTVFPSEMPMVDLMLYVSQGAPLLGVTITDVVPKGMGTEPIGGTNYSVYKATVTVEGELPQITSFIKYIEGAYDTVRIEGIKLSKLTDSEDDWQGTFTVSVITQ